MSLCTFILDLTERLRRTESRLNQLQCLVTQLQTNVNQIQNQLNNLMQPTNTLRTSLQPFLNQSITIQTEAGSITGTLSLIGNDFIQVIESSNDIVIIPLTSVLAFS